MSWTHTETMDAMELALIIESGHYYGSVCGDVLMAGQHHDGSICDERWQD